MKVETKDRILAIGTQIIAQKGYNGIGIQEVLNQVGVPKGSFYHYFKSKEDFGLQVIQKYATDTLNYIESFLTQTQYSPLTRIFNLFSDVQNVYISNNFSEGCLLGNCSNELAGNNYTFSKILEQQFIKMRNIFLICLKEAEEQKEISSGKDLEQLADFIVNSWEGAILRTKVTKDLTPMKSFVAILKTQILI
ncbi:TetR/AcrR family transcriptional regulator [Flagellimonas zhangzhouensis]|uniref:Transcriptional regulator, TetR family n=1 Tax=Flagellimonas zhangzhouensis TaxID=1073328 RepID=A0A1H2SXW9_9FLAO|nr:TetR/AcrR family transcriptional regulator [Allomuricauda zhangzhouensis]SDQ81198.1 transcriptional regulator, TetR family [Allomuricauda zhangzhouensis]SDW36556.1 transcriptional regulator, TetR family [Allomuricauda zhangzhouensis]